MMRRILTALLALAFATTAQAQFYRPGFAPGFRPGFQFIGAGGFPSPGAVVDYDFKGSRLYGPTLSVSRASDAYIDDSAGNWTLVSPNVVRRSDKGALIEGAQTNSLRTNAVTTNSMPSTWVASNPTGVSRSTQAQTRNGIDGIVVTYTGTVTATSGLNISFDSSNIIAAASGQLWSSSFFLQIDSNSGGATFNNEITERDSGGAQVTGGLTSTPLSTTGALQRYVTSRSLNGASTAYVFNRITSNAIPGGTAVNIAIWVGWPQLEQWNTAVTTVGGASSPIRTTGTAATRAADVVTATLNPAVTSGTMAGVFRNSAIQPKVGIVSAISDGTTSNLYRVRYGQGIPTSLYSETAVAGAS